ncbi:hypothetical protein [Flavobacterium sp. FlaQc-48]|uniref:hypothetical protein n=1 Tax=Flavobacterium sp. FlaQc-48 TaxID=3374181 RepID=UPI003756EC29
MVEGRIIPHSAKSTDFATTMLVKKGLISQSSEVKKRNIIMGTKSGNLTQQKYMKPFLAKKDWHQTFYQNVIIDCAVRDRNIIYFGVKEKIPPEKVSLMSKENQQIVLKRACNGTYIE